MMTLTHRLDRTMVIRASRAIVFGFFTESHAWAAWWGPGSTIDPRPGGRVLIRHPNGVEVHGEVLEVEAPGRIVFTYGYASATPIPPGGSRVTIRLDSHPSGTLLQLTHEFADVESREEHVQGWRFQLSLFANLIADRVNATAVATVDRWFSTWSDPDASAREQSLAEIGAGDIRFHDRFSCLAGADDVRAHLGAVHRFMPGLRMERRGEVRHCQWHILADWVAFAANGEARGGGTNLFVLDAEGRIAEVTGFWAA
jgi:uncharacterized protein YndB with AHSA1/START domain